MAVGFGGWFESRRAKALIRFEDEQGKQLLRIYLSFPPRSREMMPSRTLRELEKSGIRGIRLINKSSLINAISLRLFSSQAAVNKRLNELKNEKYKPVVTPYNDGKRIY